MAPHQTRLFDEPTVCEYTKILRFLEGVYESAGPYEYKGPNKESKRDALILNFTKVVSDCRAMILLANEGLYVQAGMIARSTSDACNLMMHLAFSDHAPAILKEWLAGKKVTHWHILRLVNEQAGGLLHLEGYSTTRSRLDDFVHGNYAALRLYPTQVGAAQAVERDFHNLTFWEGLVFLYLFSCLTVVSLISAKHEPECEAIAKRLLNSRYEKPEDTRSGRLKTRRGR